MKLHVEKWMCSRCNKTDINTISISIKGYEKYFAPPTYICFRCVTELMTEFEKGEDNGS